eukprot:9541251-Ditylum_brightwellii.AAC.1
MKEGKHAGLMTNTITEHRAGKGRMCYDQEGKEGRARRLNDTVPLRKLNRGGVLFPDNKYTTSGKPVMEMLQGKHPHTHIFIHWTSPNQSVNHLRPMHQCQ